MIYELTDTGKVSSLFGEWEETLIWSCLQGIMGKIYADDLDRPTAAMAINGDFTFFAGKPNVELVSYKPLWCNQSFMIMVPQNEQWERVITQFYGERAKIVSRYATKKEPHVFDKKKLAKIASSLPPSYTLSMIDKRLYHLCRTESWSADLVSQFPTYEKYRELGLGFVICKDNLIVSGASSYSRYREGIPYRTQSTIPTGNSLRGAREGIEIEIDTREGYRRNGLAYICGARLILECLNRNLYPSWDAQNTGSVALAEKLGYHYSHTYTAIEIWGY